MSKYSGDSYYSHDTVEFLSEKNSQIQPDFRIRLLSMHVGEN